MNGKHNVFENFKQNDLHDKAIEAQFCSAKEVAHYYEQLEKRKASKKARENAWIAREQKSHDLENRRHQELMKTEKQRHQENKRINILSLLISAISIFK